MGRRLILGLALLALVALSSGLSLGDRDLAIGGLGAESNEIAPSPKPPAKQPTFKGALAKAKNLAKAVIDKGKQLIGAARAAVKKEIGIVKSYLKKKWNDVKQIYQYSRHCLNHKAPKKLKLKVPNSALCATVKKAHPLFVAALEKIVDKTPQPNLKQTIAAELAGERGLRHRQQRKRGRSTVSASRASSLLETGAEIPGDPTMKWPSTLISYALSPDLDPAAVVNFQWGVNHIESLTCMRFQQVEFNVTGDGIQVLPSETKCAAIVGYQGSDGQQMWWGPDCAPGSGAHELLHALGFSHAQNRLDRDLYIKINMSLIEPGGEHNFEKKEPPFQNYGPYDFMSILHYPSTSFSITEDPVMTEILDRPASTPPPLNSPWSGDAQRDSLTEGDVAAVTEIYCKA